VVWSWTKEEDDAVMGRLAVVHERLAKKMAPVRSFSCRPLRRPHAQITEPIVIDVRTRRPREQLLGFYVVEVENLDAALDVLRVS